VTSLVSELGGTVLDYLEDAGEVENHWGFALGQELAAVDPGHRSSSSRAEIGRLDPAVHPDPESEVHSFLSDRVRQAAFV